MRRVLLVGAVTVAAFVGASPAAAALGARLSVAPEQLTTRSVTNIYVRPYWPYATGPVPADVQYPFRVQALGPNGRNMIFRPTKTSRYVWTARFTFPAPGRWELRVANYYYSARCQSRDCIYRGPKLAVRVTR